MYPGNWSISPCHRFPIKHSIYTCLYVITIDVNIKRTSLLIGLPISLWERDFIRGPIMTNGIIILLERNMKWDWLVLVLRRSWCNGLLIIIGMSDVFLRYLLCVASVKLMSRLIFASDDSDCGSLPVLVGSGWFTYS